MDLVPVSINAKELARYFFCHNIPCSKIQHCPAKIECMCPYGNTGELHGEAFEIDIIRGFIESISIAHKVLGWELNWRIIKTELEYFSQNPGDVEELIKILTRAKKIK